jgi:hypothetical protein
VSPLEAGIAKQWLDGFSAHRADRVVAPFVDDVAAQRPAIDRLRSDSKLANRAGQP